MSEFEFQLGAVLRDIITGFEGVVMVRAEYYTGCIHYGLQSQKLHEGKPIDWEWIDSSRLILAEGKEVELKTQLSPSGAHPVGPQL